MSADTATVDTTKLALSQRNRAKEDASQEKESRRRPISERAIAAV